MLWSPLFHGSLVLQDVLGSDVQMCACRTTRGHAQVKGMHIVMYVACFLLPLLEVGQF